MRERAARLGAQLTIVSRAAQRTEVRIFITAAIALKHDLAIATHVHENAAGQQKGTLNPLVDKGYRSESKFRGARATAH